MSSDRIERQVLLRAPLERVWGAIGDSRRFGKWFGMELDGPFVAGRRMSARITKTTVDEEVGRQQEPYVGMVFEIAIERVDPMRLLSFRWHPYPVDPASREPQAPTTLVEFALDPREDGVLLTLSESGFDRVPPGRREQAMRENEGGWAMQAKLVEKYLALDPEG